MKCFDNNLLLFVFFHRNIPTYVQIFLLIIEYAGIYLVSIASPIKLLSYFTTKINGSQRAVLYDFKIVTMVLNQTLSNIVTIIIMFLILFIYWLIKCILSKNASIKVFKLHWYHTVYSLVYDLLVFRMGSFLFLTILFNELISSIRLLSTVNVILSFMLGIITVWYLVSLYLHVQTYCVMFCFNSQGLSRTVLRYPYERNFSRFFDSIMILYKFIVALENAYYIEYTVDKHDHFPILLNSLIIIFVISFFAMLIYNLLINIHIQWFIINRELTLLRIGFILMNSYSLLLIMCFLKISSSNNLFIMIILNSLIWALVTLAYFWSKMVVHYVKDGKLNFKKILVAMTNNFPLKIFTINQTQLIDSLKNNYKLIRSKYSTSDDGILPLGNSKSDFELFQMYNFFRKEADNFIVDSFDKAYSDILCLFYYYFKGKIVKYFSYYNMIQRKYIKDHNILNNINLFVKISSSFFDEKVKVYSYILSDSMLNNNIVSTLDSFQSLLLTPTEMIKPLTIFNLAGEVRKLKECAKKLIKKKDPDENKTLHDQSLRMIKQLYKFFLIIHRFITETLINESLDNMNYLDIDLIEDYLNNHYNWDKILLMSIDLNRFSINKEISLLKIQKCGKEIIRYINQNMSSLFPKQFRSEGVKAFSSKLHHYIEGSIITPVNLHNNNNDNNNNIVNTNNTFEFLINSNLPTYVESFRYTFGIIPCLDKHDIIINGVYLTSEKSIIIFKEWTNGELTLETFSSSLQNWFIITPNWIQYAQSIDTFITITQLFSKCSTLDNTDYECVFVQSNVNSFLSLFNYIENDKDFFSKKEYHEIKEKLVQAKESKMKSIKFRLRFLFDVQCKSKYKVFSIVGLKNITKLSNTIYTQDINDNEANDIFELNNLVGTTNSSMSSSTNRSLSQTEKRMKQLSNQDKQVSEISKTFSKFSLLILIFNCFIIMICLIFMIIEIIQSQKLSTISGIVCKFQALRTNFGNLFINIFSNICIAHNTTTKECNNYYENYSNQLHHLTNIDPKHSVRLLLIAAVKYKIQILQEQTISYKNSIHSLQVDELDKILRSEMNYISISKGSDGLIRNKKTIEFEEGLQNFINSISIIDNAPGYFDSEKYPIYIITANGTDADFTNIFDQNLNEVQIEIYKLLMNFLNYIGGYINGEEELLKSFNHTKTINQNVLYTYIGLIIGLHIILSTLCRYIIIIVEKLLVSFLMQIGTTIIKKDCREFFLKKIENLKQLNDLYSQNPNHIIGQMEKDKKKALMKIIHCNKKKSLLTANQPIPIEENDKLLSLSNDITIDKKEFKSVIKPFLCQTYSLFTVLFLSVIIFDCFLIDSFTKVVLTHDYVLSNISIENQIYCNVAYPQIVSLLNLTLEEMALDMGIEDYDEGGVLNMKIREGIKHRESFFKMEEENPHLFPSIDSYFGDSCELIFDKINDKIIQLLSKELGADYKKFQTEMCIRFKSNSLPNFEYVYLDHNFRTQTLQNYFGTYSYKDLYLFNNKLDIYDLYTLTLITVRPLRGYIAENILYIQLDSVISSFIQIIIGYLCFNILTDILLFAIIKVLILQKMNLLHQNLLHLSKCLNLDISGVSF